MLILCMWGSEQIVQGKYGVLAALAFALAADEFMNQRGPAVRTGREKLNTRALAAALAVIVVLLHGGLVR